MGVRAAGGAPPYLGQVATRCCMPNEKAGGGLKQVMSRTRHMARDTITSLQVAFANWYGNAEVAIGADATVTASIEYPAGTFTQVLFSGVATGSIPNGSQVLSDATTVAIPDGADFFVRFFFECASGFPYNGRGGDTTNGDVIAFAVSGLADKTMADPMPANAAARFFVTPVAIVGMTTRPSILILGDSRAFGYSDLTTGSSGDIGEVARSVGPSLAYINAALSGERAGTYIAQHTQRAKLWAYCSHVICQYGTNDIFGSTSAAATYAYLSTIRGYTPAKPFFQATSPPQTTSTDGWATTANQTTKALNAERNAYNALIRGNSNGFDGVLEVADVVESARDSGIWKAPGYTADGVHELNTANIAIKDAGVIDPTEFTR